MNVKHLTEHYLEFQSLKGGCIGLSESTLVKMPHCWKSHVAAQLCFELDLCLTHYSVCLYFQDKIDSSEHVDKPPIVGQPPKHIQDIAPG